MTGSDWTEAERVRQARRIRRWKPWLARHRSSNQAWQETFLPECGEARRLLGDLDEARRL